MNPSLTRSAAIAAFVLLAAPAAAAPVQWAGNGHFYEYIGSGLSFDAALAAADAATLPGYDGYLATLTSEAENTFVGDLVKSATGNYVQTWVAGSDGETEGVWKWIAGPETGTIFWADNAPGDGQYHNWARPQEPNNNGPENGLSAFYFGNLQWNDLSTGAGNGYVVEYSLAPSGGVPEPATWAIMILGFGLAGAVLRRRETSPAS